MRRLLGSGPLWRQSRPIFQRFRHNEVSALAKNLLPASERCRDDSFCEVEPSFENENTLIKTDFAGSVAAARVRSHAGFKGAHERHENNVGRFEHREGRNADAGGTGADRGMPAVEQNEITSPSVRSRRRWMRLLPLASGDRTEKSDGPEHREVTFGGSPARWRTTEQIVLERAGSPASFPASQPPGRHGRVAQLAEQATLNR